MENRREKRIKERNAVFIKSAEENREIHYGVGINAYTYDLSLGGARLFTEKHFPVGTTIRVVIDLARTGQSVQIEGEVKWVKESEEEGLFEMGIEFLHQISQTILSLIRHLYTTGTGLSSPTTLYGPGPT